jgi:polysaccharide export outer membrane protein
MHWKFLALAAALAGAGCVFSTPVPVPTAAKSTFSTAVDPHAFALGPQDLVRVGVYGHDALGTAGTRVDVEGNLSLPLVGPVRVAGLSVSEARAAITAAYTEFVQQPRIDVSIVEPRSRRVYVLGEVAKPGAVELDRPLNVTQALALAGGFTARADRSEIVLLRGTPEALEVEVFDSEGPSERGFLALRGDDIVFVSRSNAGKFADEILPYLQGISSSLSSLATVVLIEDRLRNN